jgi:hypothetical protein
MNKMEVRRMTEPQSTPNQRCAFCGEGVVCKHGRCDECQECRLCKREAARNFKEFLEGE